MLKHTTRKSNMTWDKETEQKLLEQTKKSWGFIATESKQKLMLEDFESRKKLINSHFISRRTLKEELERLEKNEYRCDTSDAMQNSISKTLTIVYRKGIRDIREKFNL